MIKIGGEVHSIVAEVVEKMIEKWKDTPVKADTEFQTLWNAAEKEGGIRFGRELINQISKYGQS